MCDPGRQVPVAQFTVDAGAPVEARVVGVGGAGEVQALAGLTAALGHGGGGQGHQGGVPVAEHARGVTERHPAGAAAREATVGVHTLIHAHLRDAHAQS